MFILGADWWDRTTDVAGYLAPPFFLVVGYLGTLLTGTRQDKAQHQRERERDTEQRQRANLIELQEAVNLLMDTCIAMYLEIKEQVQQGKLTGEAIIKDETYRPLFQREEKCRMLATRVLDDEVRSTVFAVVAEAGDIIGARTKEELETLHDKSIETVRLFNDRTGELLRTTYR